MTGNFYLLQTSPVNAETIDFKPQVTVGDFKVGDDIPITPNTLGEYLREIYKYAIGFVGILATVVMMFGGFLWITAGGNGERVGNAKAWIGSSLTGLLLALCSWTILYIVNPNLVKFSSLNVTSPTISEEQRNESDGCCLLTNGNTFDTNETNCKSSPLYNEFNQEKIAYHNKCLLESKLPTEAECGVKVDLGGGAFICGEKCPNGKTCTLDESASTGKACSVEKNSYNGKELTWYCL